MFAFGRKATSRKPPRVSANATKRTWQRNNLEFDSDCPGSTSRSARSANLLYRKHDECESARFKPKGLAMAKNTICLWYDKDAEAAARFYAATFPDSEVTGVHKAPADFPGGKEGDVLTIEFTVCGIPCLGLNGGPMFIHSEAFSFQIATDTQEATDR